MRCIPLRFQKNVQLLLNNIKNVLWTDSTCQNCKCPPVTMDFSDEINNGRWLSRNMFEANFIIRGMCCNEGSTSRKVREKRDYLVENDPDSWFCKVLIMLAQFDFSRLDRDQYFSTADWLWGEVSEKKWIRRSKWKPQTKLDIHRSAVWTWNKILPDHSLCAFVFVSFVPFPLSLSSLFPLYVMCFCQNNIFIFKCSIFKKMWNF